MELYEQKQPPKAPARAKSKAKAQAKSSAKRVAEKTPQARSSKARSNTHPASAAIPETPNKLERPAPSTGKGKGHARKSSKAQLECVTAFLQKVDTKAATASLPSDAQPGDIQ